MRAFNTLCGQWRTDRQWISQALSELPSASQIWNGKLYRISKQQIAWNNIRMNPGIADGLIEMYGASHSGLLSEDYFRNRPAVMGKTKFRDFARSICRCFWKNVNWTMAEKAPYRFKTISEFHQFRGSAQSGPPWSAWSMQLMWKCWMKQNQCGWCWISFPLRSKGI